MNDSDDDDDVPFDCRRIPCAVANRFMCIFALTGGVSDGFGKVFELNVLACVKIY